MQIYWISEVIKELTLPTIFFLVVVILWPTFVNIKGSEKSSVISGVVLGVLLGFIANLYQEGIIDISKDFQFRESVKKLLKADVEGVYRTVSLWENAIKDQEFSGGMPPELHLNYWNVLKEDKEFLMLANDDYFDKIFKEMWDFEQIDQEIKLENEDKNRPKFVLVWYREIIKDESPKKLLLLLGMTEQKINEFSHKWGTAPD